MLLNTRRIFTGWHTAMYVWFVATVQEEVGLRGANIAAYNINPDLAIVIDVCHGQIPAHRRNRCFL